MTDRPRRRAVPSTQDQPPPDHPAPWLAEDEPLEPEEHAAQLDAVIRILGLAADAPRRAESISPPRVLDLGCGSGRIARPLADRGCDVVGVDRRAHAIDKCAELFGDRSECLRLQHGDFLSEPWPPGPYDAVLCLGNTLMEVVDLNVAHRLFRGVADALGPGGMFIIDDLPGLHWPRLAEGDWREGVSEEDDLQLVWSDRDAVFALRSPPANPSSPDAWRITRADRCFRLYTDGFLELLAGSADLSAPRAVEHAPILVMRRAGRG